MICFDGITLFLQGILCVVGLLFYVGPMCSTTALSVYPLEIVCFCLINGIVVNDS